MIQITFMNMLIAIMTLIYEQVTEKEHQSSISERISLLNDFSVFLNSFQLNLDSQYIFVVKPSSQDSLQNTIEVKLEEIASTMNKQQSTLIESVVKNGNLAEDRFQKIEDEMHEIKEVLQKKTSELAEHILNQTGDIVEERIRKLLKIE